MPEYRVTWEIDINAPSALQAAKQALQIHRSEDSIATYFEVQHKGNGRKWSIDLDEVPGRQKIEITQETSK